ncbi:replication stress response regulator SDE2 [Perognathus longimembris pacificus]|uniref:replication stress response regulator SDE2 n=1 Tax=Perognathus longimembris pacificus TaxID=214514 RepID=UPI002019A7A1|nr:replication stress response regulator SDE2 [Perognathus longimembris pacificus]
MAESPVRAWVQGPGVGRKAFWCASARCCVLDLLRRHCREQDVPVECFFVRCNGVLVGNGDAVQHGAVYTLEPRLRGGKGGFGSMLRALGAQIEKTTNREACRDLSGRRLRDVNHEKAMAEWVKQQAEREAEKEQRRLERLQRKLAEPKHCFASPDYQQQCHEMAERLEDSVLKGMQAASSKLVSAEIGEPRIRPRRSNADHGAPARKRKCLWLGMESLETAEVSSDEDSDAAPTASGLSCSSAPASGSGSAETAAELPCGSQSVGMPSAGSVAPANPPSQMADPAEDMSGDSCTGEAPSAEGRVEELGREAEATPGRKETEPAGDTAVTRLAKGHEAEEVTDGGRPAVVEPEEDIPKLEEGQSGHTGPGQEVLDLLAFGSASELELLGLERLKKELTALGLKCGGTLQERAARLFAVRGLAREQIDPALFARPSRGKKK